MADLSLSQAARLTGRSKSTIGRAIKSGRMSATRNEDGTFGINPAELLRAFPKDGPEPARGRSAGSAADGGGDGGETADLRARLAVAEALAEERARALEAAERNLADLRRMLPPPAPVTADRTARPWWRFWE